MVASKQLRGSAKGQFLSMVLLGDRTGTVNAAISDDAEATSRSLKEGDLVRVVGAVGTYNGGPQIKVERIGYYDKKQADLSDFIKSLENTPEVEQQLRHLLATVADPWLRKLMQTYFDDEVFLGRFHAATAAKAWHHAFPGRAAEAHHRAGRAGGGGGAASPRSTAISWSRPPFCTTSARSRRWRPGWPSTTPPPAAWWVILSSATR